MTPKAKTKAITIAPIPVRCKLVVDNEIVEELMAVSYTHLDVYKRQRLTHTHVERLTPLFENDPLRNNIKPHKCVI